MSDSVRPHSRQPTRLPRPWDSPGENTGVGCHFLLQCVKVRSESEVAQSCPTLSNPMDCSPPGSSVHGIFKARVLEWGATAFSEIQQWRNTKVLHTVWGPGQVPLPPRPGKELGSGGLCREAAAGSQRHWLAHLRPQVTRGHRESHV